MSLTPTPVQIIKGVKEGGIVGILALILMQLSEMNGNLDMLVTVLLGAR